MSISGNTMNINTLTVGGVNLHTFMDDITAKIEPVTYNNAYAHNSVYRGKNLGTALTVEQSAAIRNGTFKDIYPGDYWSIAVPAYSWTDSDSEVHNETGRGALTWRVLGCNSLMLKPDNNHAVAGNHVVVWVEGYTHAMNKTSSTEGGYFNSDMYKNTMLRYAAMIQAVFGEAHIMPHWDIVCNATADGKESGYIDVSNRLCDLLSEEMVFGHSFNKAGLGRTQFPAFAFNANFLVAGGTHIWLRDVANGSTFSCINHNGGYASLSAGHPTYARVSLFFLLH